MTQFVTVSSHRGQGQVFDHASWIAQALQERKTDDQVIKSTPVDLSGILCCPQLLHTSGVACPVNAAVSKTQKSARGGALLLCRNRGQEI